MLSKKKHYNLTLNTFRVAVRISQGFLQENVSKKLSDRKKLVSFSYNIDLLRQSRKMIELTKYLVITTVNFLDT